MTRDALQELLARFKEGAVGEAEVLEALAQQPFREFADARVDTHRALRQGLPEVVFGERKTPQQIAQIAGALLADGAPVLVTRVDADTARAVREERPELEYRPQARLLCHGARPVAGDGSVAVVSAGTSDSSVAEEAAVVAELLGNKVERLYDVGVAGLHRLLASLDVIRGANVVIVVAGMEGALASVVGGLVSRPVIGVPTSVGYGASFEGVTALLSMLNSCSSNVSVVNIDNGFGAAFVATLINRG